MSATRSSSVRLAELESEVTELEGGGAASEATGALKAWLNELLAYAGDGLLSAPNWRESDTNINNDPFVFRLSGVVKSISDGPGSVSPSPDAYSVKIAPNKWGGERFCYGLDPFSFDAIAYTAADENQSFNSEALALAGLPAVDEYKLSAGYVLVQAGVDTWISAWSSYATTAITNAITGVSTGSKTFTVAGNVTAGFPIGATFTVTGSTGNDGQYTVVSATFVTDHTDIVVNEVVASATADGDISQAGAAAAHFTDGDVLEAPTPLA